MKKIIFLSFLFFILLPVNNSLAVFNTVVVKRLDNTVIPTLDTKGMLSIKANVEAQDEVKMVSLYKEITNQTSITPPSQIVASNTITKIDDIGANTILNQIVPIKTLTLTSIAGMKVNDNLITFYLTNPNNNIINSIVLKTTSGNITITLNKKISEGKYSLEINNGRYIVIKNKGKKILTKEITGLTGDYTGLDISINGNIFIDKFKVYFTGVNYVYQQNAKINNTTILGASISNNNIIDLNASDRKIEEVDKNEVFTWDAKNRKFQITETINTKKKINLFIPTDLKPYLKQDINPLLAYTDLNNILDPTKVTFQKNLEIDGNTATKEFLIKLNDTNNFFLGKIEVKKTVIGNVTSYNTYVTKLYKSIIDLNNLSLLELDGDTATKEFSLTNGIYTYLFQYVGGNFNKILNEKYIKVYLGNLLDKTGTTWKVIFSLSTDTTAIGGKYYVKPLFKLYWYDPVKKMYYLKQTQDLTSYTTLNLKMNGTSIYSKTAGTLDLAGTNFIQ